MKSRQLIYRYPITTAFILGCLIIAVFTLTFRLQDLEPVAGYKPATEPTTEPTTGQATDE